MSSAGVRGQFVWHELKTSNPKSAMDFYTKVVGWKTQAYGTDGSYTLWMAKNGWPVGGLMQGTPPSWLCYIGSPDVDRSLLDVVRFGGRVVKPAQTSKEGRIAVIADPQGAMFAIFTPVEPSPGGDPTEGQFSWHELATTNPAAAYGFYARVFGWVKTDAMDMGPGFGVYQMFGAGGRTIGGIYKLQPGQPGPGWLPYARVASAKGSASAAKTAGGAVLNGPMEVPGGDWVTQVADREGATFAVHEVVAVAAAKPAKKKAKKKAKAKSVRKTAKKAAKKAAKKSARKAARKPAKKAGKRASKKKVTKKAARKG